MEKFTLPEVAELLLKNVSRYRASVYPIRPDDSAFSMGERNMATIINECLENGGDVEYIGENNMKSITPLTRK